MTKEIQNVLNVANKKNMWYNANKVVLLSSLR
jgi:hypothetical protein